MKRVLILFLILGGTAATWGIISRAHVEDMIVIDGATLIDGKGGPPVPNAVIIVDDGKIAAVFRQGERTFPTEARIIDGTNKVVIPGLFDIDTHIGQQGLEAAAQALSNYLYFGITSISDTGVTFLHGEGLRRLTAEGKLIMPNIFEAGPTFTAVGGHPIPTNRALGRAIDTRTLTQIDGPETAMVQVRRYATEMKTDTIKAALESGGELAYPRMTAQTYKALVDEAHRHHLRVYTHAVQPGDVRDALAGGVDLLAHGFAEALTPDSDIAQTMARKKVGWIPAINNAESAAKLFDHPEVWDDPSVRKAIPARYIEMAQDPEVLARVKPRLEGSRRSYQMRLKTVKMLYDMGVDIYVGTDSTGAPHRMFYGWDIHREMEHLVNAGMKPMDVLVAATRKPAEFLGKGAQLGTIEPGKRADMVLLSKDPLQDIRNSRAIHTVILQGQVVDRDRMAMLDPFKEGLVATGKEQQQIVNQGIEQDIAARFPAATEKDLVIQQCGGCHSLQPVLDARKTQAEWETTVFGMLGRQDAEAQSIAKYLAAHFGP